jgi:membrane protein YdbS with pleckstrin-like domain
MKQLDPKAKWLLFINVFGRFIFAILFLIFFVGLNVSQGTNLFVRYPLSSFNIYKIFLISLTLIIYFSYFWARLSYHFYLYEMREDGFRKELGVIAKTYVTIPYDRIQNVDINRGIVSRLLGLSDLNIQTAGASVRTPHGEGRLPGLSKEVAEQLRDELITRSQDHRLS